MLKTYVTLTKPGIIMGNTITAIGGFALASKGYIDFLLFLNTLFGLALIIASACVCNNYIDRKIDEKMTRTKNRALVVGSISNQKALVFATCLGLLGTIVLAFSTNLLTVLSALFGWFIYVALYSPIKHRSSFATVVGSIAGAIPPVVGYYAVSNHFDIGALSIFLIVAFWQMPHFFAIAIYRYKDYVDASIPVLPITKGIFITKIHMLLYVIAFLFATCLPTLFGYTGNAYLLIMITLGFTWFLLCLKGFTNGNDTLWARKMFLFSLVIITIFCAVISFDVIQDETIAKHPNPLLHNC